MTTIPTPSELNPTGELREWYWITFDHTVVRGKMYNHLEIIDGSTVSVINIVQVVNYKDHTIIITEGGDYFKLEHVMRNMNGI